jgi:hypothetical protein
MLDADAQQERKALAAERMRRSRERRREGVRHVGIDIRDTESAELVRRGLLAPSDQDDPAAISGALGRLLDEVLSA